MLAGERRTNDQGLTTYRADASTGPGPPVLGRPVSLHVLNRLGVIQA